MVGMTRTPNSVDGARAARTERTRLRPWLAVGLCGLVGLAACDLMGGGTASTAPMAAAGRELPIVEVFVTDWCPYCQRLEAFLKDNEVPYLRKNIEENTDFRVEHAQLGGGGIPVTRIGGTEVIRGFRPDVIAQALDLETP